jgi:hypothetical protein
MALDHEEMLQEIKKIISEQMQSHEIRLHNDHAQRDFDGIVMSPVEIVKGHVAMRHEQTELANAMLGTPRSDFMGGGRNHDGFIHTVKELAAKQQDVRLRIPATVWVAIITTIGLLGAAVIGLFESVP